MGQNIVQIQQMGDALRSSGYKSIDSALAEIVDNSIEAQADDVFVIMREHVDPQTHRNSIYEFAILDNGTGMDIDQLSCCLGIGFTTRSERKGMGRFGVGLPQASLYVTPHVEVYSWNSDIGDDNKAYRVWLDIDKIKAGVQTEIEDPDLCAIPKEFEKFLCYRTAEKKYDFTRHGTLVYWKNCDNVKPKTMTSLCDRLEFFIGRKFRHIIADGHSIRLITLGHEDIAIDILPNDPLLLMTPNYVLGNLQKPGEISPRVNTECTEPIFEPFATEKHPTGEIHIPIHYIDKDTGVQRTSDVVIRYSKVRPQFYDQVAFPAGNPGSTPLGEYAKKLEGISVVRAGREIDFGAFDFYDRVNNPYHRWWGCEICFDPVLDEIFGVANNKQQVELRDEHVIGDQDAGEAIWDTLATEIKGTISKMVSENKELRKDSRSGDREDNDAKEPERIIDEAEKDIGDGEGVAQEERAHTPKEELEDRARQYLMNMGEEAPTIDRIRNILKKDTILAYMSLGRGGAFIDTDFSLGNVNVRINTAHIFYSEFIEKMGDDARLAFELFVGALAQAINKTDVHQQDANDRLLQEWDRRLKHYLEQIKDK